MEGHISWGGEKVEEVLELGCGLSVQRTRRPLDANTLKSQCKTEVGHILDGSGVCIQLL